MKNRILGIAVLLAAVVLGMAFVSCGPAEDTELTFVNKTGIDIYITTDGSPASITLNKLTGLLAQEDKKTVTKAGSDITIKTITYGIDFITADNVGDFIDIDLSALPSKKQPKAGVSLGSGTIVFKPMLRDDGNPGIAVSKISIIPAGE